jgi:hypothetical protein
MKITSWYKNGSFDTFSQFCIQNKGRPISVKLINRSEPVRGSLHSYRLSSSNAAGLFLLLSDRVIHPAYYGLSCIESLHNGFDEAWFPRMDGASAEDELPLEITVSRSLALRAVHRRREN